MKKTFLLLAVMIFSSISFAASDTAIIATDLTNVDAMVASAAASSEGMPVLVTENGMLNDDTRNELISSKIKNVIIIGGPLVVKQEAEDELKLKYKVIRLWGIERTQTAIEVAKHFWNSECAVLVGDTKNDEKDAKIQLHASNLASRFGCALIPVPDGTVPAEVLKTLDELNVTHVKFVGRMNDGIRKSVKKFVLEEFEDENEIEKSILNESDGRIKFKIVIVATPDWRIANAIGSEPHHNSVVKMVSDASNETVQKLVALIKENNITDVRVVGIPALAQEIATKLQSEGINATKISGNKASEIAKEVWKRNKERWNEIRGEAEHRNAGMKLKMKIRLESIANETETEFEEEEIELEVLEADTSVLKQKLDEMKSILAEAKQKIASGDVDGAKLLMAEARSEFRLRKWHDRDRIKWEWRLEIEDEEGNNNNIDNEYRKRLDNLDRSINDFRKACNATAIESLVEKAKSLLAEAKNETDSVKAAKLLREAKHVINEARSIGAICLKEKKLLRRHMEIAKKRVEKAEELRGKISARHGNIMGKLQERRDSSAKEFNITSSSFSFTPNSISVSKGDKVKLRVTNTEGTHNLVIDELGISKDTPLGETEIEFTATKSGTFAFYCGIDSHRASGMEGSIVVG